MRYLRAITALILSFAIFTAQIGAAGKYINLKLTYDGKTHNYNAEEVTLVVNNKTLTNLPMPPIIMDNYTLVPAREVFEALGAKVNWLSDLYQVYITYGEQVVMLEIDSKKAYVNGKPLDMSVAPKIINNKTMIPLRFASESIGMEVGWNSKTRVATVNKPVVTTTTTTTTTKAATTTTTTEATTETTTVAVNISKIGSSANMNGYVSGDYDKARVKALTKAVDSNNMYLVGTDNPISTVSVNKLNNNMVAVDINNTTNALTYGCYNVSDGNVKNIEISQQSGLKPSTRFLFNLDKPADFSLYLSSDRCTLGISLGTNEITAITMDKLLGGDKLTITGKSKPNIKATTSSTGDLITIDVMDSVLKTDNGTFAEGRVINGGSYHQFNANTVRISIDLKEEAGFTTTEKNNSVSLTIATGIDMGNYQTSGGEVRYDNNLGLILPGAAGIVNPSSVTHTDNYMALNYVLTLPGNLSGLLSDKTVTVNDDNIKNIEISVNNGQTTVKFNENRVMAVNVTSNGSDLYIKPVLPKEKYSKIIVLDAGHGGDDPGTGYNGIVEKDLTLAMLNKTKALFDKSDIKCYATRTTDVYPTFNERTNLADVGDAFISIHINSVTGNSAASGTETFCQYPNNLGNGLTSYIVAEKVLDKLLENLGTVNRKVKSNDLIVLRNSHVPATLAEIGFITNDSDRAMMASEDGQNKVARAIYDAVTEMFNEYQPVR